MNEQQDVRSSPNSEHHDPLCLLSDPCGPDDPKHGFCSRQQNWCIHCERECICERIYTVEERALRRGEASDE